MSAAAPTTSSPRQRVLESPIALWAGMMLSVLLHGALVLFSHLFPWNAVALQNIESEGTAFHEVGLVERPKRTADDNRPATQQESNRPKTALAKLDQAAPKRPEVSEQPPIAPLLPGTGKTIVGPGNAAPAFGGGNDGERAGTSLPSGIVGQPPRLPGAAGEGEAEFFNITEKGKRLVYVVDRSGSMGRNNALEHAKARLKRSLEGLTPKHQFIVVFYDTNAFELNLDAASRGYIPATSWNVREIVKKLRLMRPDKGTDHMKALRPALAKEPDAVYFLTDATDGLSQRELDALRTLNNRGARIHCIEFGKGADLSGESNYLKRLAAQTGGRYHYENVEKFR